MDNSNTLVSIICNTYNHEPYIRQCLEGFVMQKTDFAFEVLIHDDASTDKTANIIREYEAQYPDIIKPIYQTENQYSKKIGIMKTFQYPRVKGKYIALCEGDDYWIDPLKLQKQVEYLESHTDCGMCFGKVRSYIQSKHKFMFNYFGSEVKSMEDLLLINTIPTLTVMYCKDLYSQYLKESEIHKNKWLLGDYPMWLYMAYHSKIHFIDDTFGVYRILDNSASHSTDIDKQERFINSAYDMRLYFAKKYSIGDINRIQSDRYEIQIFNAIKHGNKERLIYWYKLLDDVKPIFYLKFIYHIIMNFPKFFK